MLCVFFFNDTATTEIYTLSLHDALPIYGRAVEDQLDRPVDVVRVGHRADELVDRDEAVVVLEQERTHLDHRDRKSTRLNSSHANISYAVFCLKKKNNRAYTATVPPSRDA